MGQRTAVAPAPVASAKGAIAKPLAPGSSNYHNGRQAEEVHAEGRRGLPGHPGAGAGAGTRVRQRQLSVV